MHLVVPRRWSGLATIAVACALAITLALAAVVHAAEPPQARQLKDWERALDRAERTITQGQLTADSVQKTWDEIEPLRELARAARRAARELGKSERQLREALGPAPAEGEPAETAEIARKRTEFDQRISTAESSAKAADLLVKRADAVLEKLATFRFEARKQTLLARAAAPLSLEIWHEAIAQVRAAVAAIGQGPDVRAYRPPLAVLVPALALLVALALGAGRLMRRLLARYGPDPAVPHPPYTRRVLAAFVVALERGLVPALVFSGLLVAAWNYYLRDALDPAFGQPTGFVAAIVVLLLGTALVGAAFAPAIPHWRLVPVTADAARKMGWRLYALVAVIALDVALRFFFARTGGMPAELSAVYSFSVNVVLAGALLSVTTGRVWRTDPSTAGAPEALWFWPLLRVVVILVALAAPIANVLGYQVLADTLLRSTVRTIVLLAGLAAVHVLVREAVAAMLMHEHGTAASIRQRLGMTLESGRSLGFWLGFAADTVLFVLGMVGVSIVWGLQTTDVSRWREIFTQGLHIGSYTFAPGDILIAVGVFVAIVAFSRFIQHFLERQVFPQTRLDIGVRTAVNAGVSYLGLIIAILIAISMLGIDLTKLAIIAGALSVGIGFGLQNIVNNFVSGLILLIERPIKIGDWVMVGSVSGTVRRINVRSTQLETAQRADVIIPNADLLQSAVVNWTHKNREGRIEIKLGVDYGADVTQVETILLEVARTHARLQKKPEPIVLFTNFGDSALEFELRAFLYNVEDKALVESDLRKTILARFRQAGIELPFPQRDVWVRNFPQPQAPAS